MDFHKLSETDQQKVERGIIEMLKYRGNANEQQIRASKSFVFVRKETIESWMDSRETWAKPGWVQKLPEGIVVFRDVRMSQGGKVVDQLVVELGNGVTASVTGGSASTRDSGD